MVLASAQAILPSVYVASKMPAHPRLAHLSSIVPLRSGPPLKRRACDVFATSDGEIFLRTARKNVLF
jgi:hypothetical protein